MNASFPIIHCSHCRILATPGAGHAGDEVWAPHHGHRIPRQVIRIDRLRIVIVSWKEIQDNTNTIRLNMKRPLHV